jgi:hypothetical protein
MTIHCPNSHSSVAARRHLQPLTVAPAGRRRALLHSSGRPAFPHRSSPALRRSRHHRDRGRTDASAGRLNCPGRSAHQSLFDRTCPRLPACSKAAWVRSNSPPRLTGPSRLSRSTYCCGDIASSHERAVACAHPVALRSTLRVAGLSDGNRGRFEASKAQRWRRVDHGRVEGQRGRSARCPSRSQWFALSAPNCMWHSVLLLDRRKRCRGSACRLMSMADRDASFLQPTSPCCSATGCGGRSLLNGFGSRRRNLPTSPSPNLPSSAFAFRIPVDVGPTPDGVRPFCVGPSQGGAFGAAPPWIRRE